MFGLMLFMLEAGLATAALVMLLLWLLGLRNRNFSYADIGWSANFALLGAIYATLGVGWPVRKVLIASLFAIHGLRLAWHLARRIVGHPEEGRYVQLRREWGGNGERALNFRFLAFFELQALLNVFLSLPLAIACLNPEPPLHPFEYAGAALWLIGVLGESTADAQLARFRNDASRRGRVCDRGLWRYSRHPNYFFEWLVWVGYAVFALGSPHGWVAFAMPLLMLHFLVNVTGIRATEAQALRSKGEEYRRYQARTSPFVPWRPKKET